MSYKFKSIEELTLLEANTELKNLIKDIKYYDDMYYNGNKSVISDAEYDRLRNRLQAIETKYPILKSNNSPSYKIGSPVISNKFSHVSHNTPMLSLSNTFNSEDFMNLFDGNSDHNYNTPKIANITNTMNAIIKFTIPTATIPDILPPTATPDININIIKTKIGIIK